MRRVLRKPDCIMPWTLENIWYEKINQEKWTRVMQVQLWFYHSCIKPAVTMLPKSQKPLPSAAATRFARPNTANTFGSAATVVAAIQVHLPVGQSQIGTEPRFVWFSACFWKRFWLQVCLKHTQTVTSSLPTLTIEHVLPLAHAKH